jgi:hypothetical protein
MRSLLNETQTMPILLLPFLVHAAAMQKKQNQTNNELVDIQRKQYELNLAEYNERHHIKPAPTPIILKKAWKH